jgi:hypothetical protein
VLDQKRSAERTNDGVGACGPLLRAAMNHRARARR